MTLNEQASNAERIAARLSGDDAAGLFEAARTLRWLDRWSSVVREAVAERKRAIEEMRAVQEMRAEEAAEALAGLAEPDREAVDHVLETFEGATVSVVTTGERR